MPGGEWVTLNANTDAASLVEGSLCIAVCFVAEDFFRPGIFLNKAVGQDGKFIGAEGRVFNSTCIQYRSHIRYS